MDLVTIFLGQEKAFIMTVDDNDDDDDGTRIFVAYLPSLHCSMHGVL